MNDKKITGLFCFLLISLLIINTGVISAQTPGATAAKGSTIDLGEEAGKVLDSVFKIIQTTYDKVLMPLAKLLLVSPGKKETLANDLIFAKLLFFLIFLGVVHFALNRVEFFQNQNRFLYGLVVFVVAILATMWLATGEIIKLIILPYSVLGIAVSAGLPFIIYFLMVDIGFKGDDYSFLRKIAWIFFGVVFIGLWYARAGEIGGSFHYIYLVTALAAFVMALIDGTIQNFFREARQKRVTNKLNTKALTDVLDEVVKLQERFAKKVIDPQAYAAEMRDLQARAKAIRSTRGP